ncbi:MAG TPA: hypothetical protein VLM85_08150, partial [Polyangiaceae bacterium]|nr:hypothetical protein [Polyangiaceae bacterium]
SGSPLEELGGTLVFEKVTGESWLPSFSQALLSIGLVPARDGVRVELDGKSVYVTPDDLLARQGYDHGVDVDAISLTVGVDMPLVVAMASERLGQSPLDVRDHARFRRIRTERVIPGSLPDLPANASTFDDALATRFVLGAARYLARGVSPEGRFRYLVNAPTNQTLGGYDWPRHAGATYFLAQASSFALRAGDPDALTMRQAALRAAALLRGPALVKCGAHECIGDPAALEIGSIALTVIAFTQIAKDGLDPSYGPLARELCETLLSTQRPDGEFMHELGRDGTPIDVQLPYFSGEAALALARAHALLGDQRFLAASEAAVHHLVGPAWHFFGDRYYYGEEHWTCQAAGELYDRWTSDAEARDGALDFCLRWQGFTRKLQQHEGECAFDCDGGLGVGPFITPRLTPVGSRCEAGVATLGAATKAHVDPAELERLRTQLRRSLALLFRHQMRGRLDYLLSEPDAVRGAMPGSEVDWQLRIDYAQHSGSAMLRWIDLPSSAKRP